eukprot:3283752-Alexandrium_andersonii.AAC.1
MQNYSHILSHTRVAKTGGRSPPPHVGLELLCPPVLRAGRPGRDHLSSALLEMFVGNSAIPKAIDWTEMRSDPTKLKDRESPGRRRAFATVGYGRKQRDTDGSLLAQAFRHGQPVSIDLENANSTWPEASRKQ